MRSSGKYFCKELNKSLPSVTTILDIISKGEGFNNWLKKQGANADNIVTEAADFGSNIHNHLECIGKGIKMNLDALKPRERRCVEAFLKWKDENIAEFIQTEHEVFNVKDEYAGTLDAVVRLKDGRICVLDYKTSGGIYDTHELQVVAYCEAYNHNVPCAYILRFEKNDDKPKDLEIREVKDLDGQYQVFLAALKLYNWKHNKKEATNG